jgi:dirigent-like protein
VLALAAAVLVCASASSARSERAMTIRLVSVATSARPVDKPPAGPSKGDQIIETSRLSNAVSQFGKAKGAVVGHDKATLTILSPTALTLDGVATLPGGTIAIRGPVESSSGRVTTIPVKGGTGRYAHARGSVVLTQLDTNRALNVYRLSLP